MVFKFGYNSGVDITLDGLGNIFVTVYTNRYGAGGLDALLLKYDTGGNLLWNKTWGGFDYDIGRGIVIDDFRNIFITGSTSSYGAGDGDVLLLKYDSSGNCCLNMILLVIMEASIIPSLI